MNTKADTSERKNEIKRFIMVDLANDESLNLQDDDDLLISGLLDSVSVMKLISHIETLCDTKIPPEDILIEHFGSVTQIDEYLNGRLAKYA